MMEEVLDFSEWGEVFGVTRSPQSQLPHWYVVQAVAELRVIVLMAGDKSEPYITGMQDPAGLALSAWVQHVAVNPHQSHGDLWAVWNRLQRDLLGISELDLLPWHKAPRVEQLWVIGAIGMIRALCFTDD